MLQSTFLGKRLPGSGRKQKSRFDHSEIIRGYVYANSVVHATQIYLCSLIGARTCMRIALNLTSAEYYANKCIEVNDIDCLLDNNMVISEHRKSCYWKMSAQPSQKMGFGKITPHRESAETHFFNVVLND